MGGDVELGGVRHHLPSNPSRNVGTHRLLQLHLVSDSAGIGPSRTPLLVAPHRGKARREPAFVNTFPPVQGLPPPAGLNFNSIPREKGLLSSGTTPNVRAASAPKSKAATSPLRHSYKSPPLPNGFLPTPRLRLPTGLDCGRVQREKGAVSSWTAACPAPARPKKTEPAEVELEESAFLNGILPLQGLPAASWSSSPYQKGLFPLFPAEMVQLEAKG
jgi:hypothetical protein